MRWTWSILLVMLASFSVAQTENWLQGDFRNEKRRIDESCPFRFGAIGGCAYELFTDHPMHFAAGSLPPQNGFGLGLAFGEARETANWRNSYDIDAVGSTNGSWRAGAYIKFVHTGSSSPKTRSIIKVTHDDPNQPKPPGAKRHPDFVHPYTVYNLYAQAISLNKLNYFGEGNETVLADASLFGMTQTIVGASVIKPVYEWQPIRTLNLSLNAEANGRFVSIRGDGGQSVPTIYSLYDDSTAPGLSSQPAFIQLGEGFRIAPTLGQYFSLNYSATIQEFYAPSASQNSFQRWTVDANHVINLYGSKRHPLLVTSGNEKGPDSCAYGGDTCPSIPKSLNLSGSVNFRFLLSESMHSSTSAVPFYFQQTLGGDDINSALSLGSYQDYRFRAPNLFLMQAGIEHSVWGPFGLKFTADEGRVALDRSDIGFSHLKHTFAAGITIRAGGVPMISMMFAWGGSEGTHNLFNMNNSLLGGAARPALD